MNGTSHSQTRAIERTPPRITTAVSAVSTRPVQTGATPAVCSSSVAIELACTMQPIPKAATAVRTAKTSPSQRAPSPRSRAYIGPPAISPRAVVTR